MNADQWQEVLEVFHDAVALPEARRSRFIETALAGNPALIGEVASLLANHNEEPGLLDRPAVRLTGLGSEPEPAEAPETIGRYRVLGRLGAGGMGVVYLAERADSYRNRVAIKLLKRGMDSEEILRRFRAEGRILASLEHPGITRILEGGIQDDGRPYFVLEHVPDGVAIDRYCERHELSLPARLALFRQACDAVQYAHRRLIVHRDLKPSNLLVSRDGQVKLLDFGIAKLLDPSAVELSQLAETGAGMRLLTPDYASPEQVHGEPLTTASDIYSLGVILYELLTGARPYRPEDTTPAALARAITDQLPEPPSTAVARAAAGAESAVAGGRELSHQLSGDLDNIVLKALRKEPEERYGSAEALSADIRRFLEKRPVSARPLTTGYRLRRYVQRHAAMVALGALAVLALAAGLVSTAWQARVARAERDRARLEGAKVERVADVLVELFDLSDPGRQAGGETMTLREFADFAETKAVAELEGQADVLAKLRTVLGRLNISLARYDRAEGLLAAAIEEQRRLYPDGHLDLASALSLHAGALFFQQDLDGALAAAEEALEMRRRLVGEDDLGVAEILERLAQIRGGLADAGQAAQTRRRSLEIRRRLLPADDPRIASSLGALAVTHYERAEYAQAIELGEQALAIKRAAFGDVHQSVAHELNNLGAFYQAAGRYEEAEATHREALRVRTEVYGPDHPYVAFSHAHLGRLALLRGDDEEALAAFERALAIREGVYGREHLLVARSMVDLGSALGEVGRHERAEELLAEAVEIVRRTRGDRHPALAAALVALGRNRCEVAECAGAERPLREAVTIRLAQTPPNPVALATARAALGQALAARGELEEAERNLNAAVTTWEKLFPHGHVDAVPAYLAAGDLARLRGDPAVARWRYAAALAALERVLPPDHRRLVPVRRRLQELDRRDPDSTGG